MLALLLALTSVAQDVDPAQVEVAELEFELPELESRDRFVLGFVALDDGTVEARAGRVDPYRPFKFTVSIGGDTAADVFDLCLDGRCPNAVVDVGDEVWLYAPSTSSTSSASDPEWRYVPVRRLGL